MRTDDSWIQTFSGRKVWPLYLRPDDVCIEDVAHSLSMLCRFTGATKYFYSVAQHSVLVSRYSEQEDALWGLLHDASEAYLLDIPRPLKRHDDFAFYRTAEEDAMRAICVAFGLSLEMPASVKTADQRMLATEARDLMAPLHPDWRTLDEPYRETVQCWSPGYAETMFLQRFRRLMGVRS